MKNFFTKVYRITKLIPEGRVSTYGAIAEYLGTKSSARVVGWALNNCQFNEGYIPAHRVVNRNGILSGKNHFPNDKTMQELLESEGITIENNQVVNFEKVFWNPNKEIS
ncbi:MAG: cysteine methyltransferase [Marinilabiliales bacterium]|nr:MAG: cysteine methyltransferase [Marinilabiliales bacterium]